MTLNLKIDPSAQAEQMGDDVCFADKGDSGTEGTFPVGKHLLLAEDNDLNMEIAQTLLENLGFTVRGVRNGREALETFAASKPEEYDAILMDLQMPVMDGYTAAREIRACGHVRAGTVPIIALTANAFAEDIAKALSAGMNDHVSKPIDYVRLVDVIRKCINK